VAAKFKRIRDDSDEDNYIKLTVEEGSIEIRGEGDFVTGLFKAMCETEEFCALVRRNLNGATREEVAAQLREQGFPEHLCRDIEDGIIWDDFIDA